MSNTAGERRDALPGLYHLRYFLLDVSTAQLHEMLKMPQKFMYIPPSVDKSLTATDPHAVNRLHDAHGLAAAALQGAGYSADDSTTRIVGILDGLYELMARVANRQWPEACDISDRLSANLNYLRTCERTISASLDAMNDPVGMDVGEKPADRQAAVKTALMPSAAMIAQLIDMARLSAEDETSVSELAILSALKRLARAKDGQAESLWGRLYQRMQETAGWVSPETSPPTRAVDADEDGNIFHRITCDVDSFPPSMEQLWTEKTWPALRDLLNGLPDVEAPVAVAEVAAKHGRLNATDDPREAADYEVRKGRERQPPSTPNRKPKCSTQKGDAETKLIAALTEHHQYQNGSCLNLEPIGSNKLARQANVASSSASEFMKKQFGSLNKYKGCCRDSMTLISALKLLLHEFTPGILFHAQAVPGEGRNENRNDDV